LPLLTVRTLLLLTVYLYTGDFTKQSESDIAIKEQ